MRINNISSTKNNTFGVNYSDELLTGMSEITKRFQFAKHNLAEKFIERSQNGSILYSPRYRRIADQFVKSNYKIVKLFDTINNAFPFRTLYTKQNPKDGKYYFAMKTFLGEKLLAPIRTLGNVNPIEHPEAIHLKITDIEMLADKFKKMKTEEEISNFLNMHFKKRR